jgi:hypothetical protein
MGATVFWFFFNPASGLQVAGQTDATLGQRLTALQLLAADYEFLGNKKKAVEVGIAKSHFSLPLLFLCTIDTPGFSEACPW